MKIMRRTHSTYIEWLMILELYDSSVGNNNMAKWSSTMHEIMDPNTQLRQSECCFIFSSRAKRYNKN